MRFSLYSNKLDEYSRKLNHSKPLANNYKLIAKDLSFIKNFYEKEQKLFNKLLIPKSERKRRNKVVIDKNKTKL